MSDLQCPSIVVLIAAESIVRDDGRRVLAGRRLAAVFVAAPIAADPDARAAAARLAVASACTFEVMADVVDGATLRAGVDDLSDLYRGETVAVVASADMIGDVLGRAQAEEEPVAVAIDSSGWTVLGPGAR
jgi:hypothetical protein